MQTSLKSTLLAGFALALVGCQSTSAPQAVAAAPAASADPLANPAPSEWTSDGRDYTAQRFSPLTQVTAQNVDQLGLAWFADLDTYRGVEATPLYADGVLYNTLSWNITTAYEARTGQVLWTYDPQTPREFGRLACCEPVSRGLAMYGDKVVIATLDGRLIALDKRTGQPVWSTRTFEVDSGYAYSITGAPRVFGDLVVVGQSGGDLGVRGFVSAYDVNTGEQAWKFYLTPSPTDTPDGAASDSVNALMRETWADEGMWRQLGGGANP
ncbi:MAG TPA: PQQ-binding-like beta-propeller repeat protein, partial [Paracoccaceae bacterium]|nr:PQQ-binding-like beta-propeller repeat protein [Paracoccaceae bacterium]